MADVLVVADDLTGANAAAAGFARAGLRAVTASAAQHAEVGAEMVARFDVVVVTTDSRHEPPARAAERLGAVVRAGWPARLVCNRIDTTLRGNVGATTRAVRDEVARLAGGRVVVLCAPAHPGADRHTIGGTQLLRGRRLEETEVAHDARTPVRTSDVVALIRQQADLVARVVSMDVVTGAERDLVAVVGDALDAGVEVVVADATTVEHLDRVAAAAVAAGRSRDVRWVTSDPGPASVAMATALGLTSQGGGAPLLAVSGSATELTRTQLRQVAADRNARLLRTPTSDDGAVPDTDASAALLGKALEEAAPGDIVVLATVLEDADVRPVDAQQAADIPVALARAVRRNLQEHPVDGLFCTGGDVTAALLRELGSQGLEISDEVVPLAVAGSVVGGPWDGLQVVTKGGLVGDARTTVDCLDRLRANAEMHRRLVTSAQSRSMF